MPKNTVLSAQMEQAWFWRRAWCKLQTSHCEYQWIPENQILAVKWQFWKQHKNEWVPVVLSNQMYCQDSGQAIWKPANRRGLPATLLWEASARRHSAMSLHSFSTPPSPHHFLVSKEGVDNLCRVEHSSTSPHQLSLLRRKLIQAG